VELGRGIVPDPGKSDLEVQRTETGVQKSNAEVQKSEPGVQRSISEVQKSVPDCENNRQNS
jgi:hypothetical protein